MKTALLLANVISLPLGSAAAALAGDLGIENKIIRGFSYTELIMPSDLLSDVLEITVNLAKS